MQFKFLITLLFLSNLCLGQKLKIEILNDTIKKVSYFDQCNIVYTITNTSDKNCYFILNSKEFNEDPDYAVELPFVGLPEYYLFEKKEKLIPKYSFGSNTNNFIDEFTDLSSVEFKKFEEKYTKFYNDYDLKIAYRISKNLICLKPKEIRVFITQINFPNYRGRYYEMVNKGIYNIQISLHNPKEIISKYWKVLEDSLDDNTNIFTGHIFSNKIPLIYEVYNDN